jgi:hypothetical protein
VPCCYVPGGDLAILDEWSLDLIEKDQAKDDLKRLMVMRSHRFSPSYSQLSVRTLSPRI